MLQTKSMEANWQHVENTCVLILVQEFNLIAISYWLFIGDVGSLIGQEPQQASTLLTMV